MTKSTIGQCLSAVLISIWNAYRESKYALSKLKKQINLKLIETTYRSHNQGEIAGIFTLMIPGIAIQKMEVSPTLKTLDMSDITWNILPDWPLWIQEIQLRTTPLSLMPFYRYGLPSMNHPGSEDKRYCSNNSGGLLHDAHSTSGVAFDCSA